MATRVKCSTCGQKVDTCARPWRRHNLAHAVAGVGTYGKCFGQPEGFIPVVKCSGCILRDVCLVSGHVIHEK